MAQVLERRSRMNNSETQSNHIFMTKSQESGTYTAYVQCSDQKHTLNTMAFNIWIIIIIIKSGECTLKLNTHSVVYLRIYAFLGQQHSTIVLNQSHLGRKWTKWTKAENGRNKLIEIIKRTKRSRKRSKTVTD